MKKSKAQKILKQKKKFFYQSDLETIHSAVEQHLDKEIKVQEKKLKKILKKLHSKGDTDVFLTNHILTELHIKSGLI